jgi:hypothetical protein
MMFGLLALQAGEGTPEGPPPESRRLGNNLQLSGFGTLGLASTDTHKVQFRRDASQPGGAIDHPTPSVDSRLGLQLSSRLGENLLATVQVESRQRYDGTWHPDLQWACLTWTPGRAWEFKGGRVGLERLPNWDYANVGYTMLWVRPPVEAFGKNNFTYMDGLAINRSFDVGDTTLVAGVFGGFLDEKAPAAAGTYPLDLTDSGIWGGIVKVRRGGFRGRVSFTQLRVSKNFRATGFDLGTFLHAFHNPALDQAVDAFYTRGHVFRNIQLGGAYERGPIQAQAALVRNTSDVASLSDSWAGFASFGYRLGPVVPYAIYSRAVSSRPADPDLRALTLPFLPPQIRAVAPLVVASLHAQDMDQWSVSAGLRWDFAATADLKFQVDRVRDHNAITPWVATGSSPGWDGKAMVYSVVLDFVFGGVR